MVIHRGLLGWNGTGTEPVIRIWLCVCLTSVQPGLPETADDHIHGL